ncbi:phage tail tube protein [Burkholderia vietnamiensis]|uniref:phage tail tube protein n=1 Tax=Burkholderia vietnamiensis TaxID=60552 RepID=UPI000841904C|nr:phage tail tube protein [Burkholderia vietnamiensis]AOK40840.1 phage tail protein [Burkholderia vietnamiensis]
MGKKTAGTCYVKVAGKQLEITGGVECPLSDTERETIKPGFFSEKEKAPYVKVDALFTPDFPIDTVMKGTNMTVTVEFANSRVYVLSGAYVVSGASTTGDDGKTPLTFEGRKGSWQ